MVRVDEKTLELIKKAAKVSAELANSRHREKDGVGNTITGVIYNTICHGACASRALALLTARSLTAFGVSRRRVAGPAQRVFFSDRRFTSLAEAFKSISSVLFSL